jgi:hypothetical protein
MNNVEQMIRDANPIQGEPELLSNDELDALLLLAKTRSGIVDVQELTKPVEPEKKDRRGWLVAAVAFAVVFVLVGAAMLFSSPADDTPPATTPPTTAAAPTTTVAAIEETPTTIVAAVEETPTTIVAAVSDVETATIAAFETAWNDGDEDATRVLFAPGAVFENPILFDGADVDRLLRYSAGQRTMGTELSIDGCAPSGENVICTAEFDGLVPIAMNFVPWRDRYIFSFEDGQITHIKVSCIICWDGDADERLRAWVKTVDPTALATLTFAYNLPETEEKAAAWLEWAPKWQEAGRP